jgi:hypothetical protein
MCLDERDNHVGAEGIRSERPVLRQCGNKNFSQMIGRYHRTVDSVGRGWKKTRKLITAERVEFVGDEKNAFIAAIRFELPMLASEDTVAVERSDQHGNGPALITLFFNGESFLQIEISYHPRFSGIFCDKRMPRDREHQYRDEAPHARILSGNPDSIQSKTRFKEKSLLSQRHLKPGMAGEFALAFVKGEKVRGPQVHGRGDVENIEGTVSAAGSALV